MVSGDTDGDWRCPWHERKSAHLAHVLPVFSLGRKWKGGLDKGCFDRAFEVGFLARGENHEVVKSSFAAFIIERVDALSVNRCGRFPKLLRNLKKNLFCSRINFLVAKVSGKCCLRACPRRNHLLRSSFPPAGILRLRSQSRPVEWSLPLKVPKAFCFGRASHSIFPDFPKAG